MESLPREIICKITAELSSLETVLLSRTSRDVRDVLLPFVESTIITPMDYDGAPLTVIEYGILTTTNQRAQYLPLLVRTNARSLLRHIDWRSIPVSVILDLVDYIVLSGPDIGFTIEADPESLTISMQNWIPSAADIIPILVRRYTDNMRFWNIILCGRVPKNMITSIAIIAARHSDLALNVLHRHMIRYQRDRPVIGGPVRRRIISEPEIERDDIPMGEICDAGLCGLYVYVYIMRDCRHCLSDYINAASRRSITYEPMSYVPAHWSQTLGVVFSMYATYGRDPAVRILDAMFALCLPRTTTVEHALERCPNTDIRMLLRERYGIMLYGHIKYDDDLYE